MGTDIWAEMIAVFDGGFGMDKIPALYNIRLAGIKGLCGPSIQEYFLRWAWNDGAFYHITNYAQLFVGVAPEAQYLLVSCGDERTESRQKGGLLGFAAGIY